MPETQKKNRQYTEDFKAHVLTALVANGGNINRTALYFGISPQLLALWKRGKGINAAIPRKLGMKKKEMLDEIGDKLVSLFAALTPEKAEASNAVQLTTSIGTLIDKQALLEAETALTRDEAETFKQQLYQAIEQVFPGNHAALKQIRDEFARIRAGSAGNLEAADTPSIAGGETAVESLGEALS